MRSIKYIIRKRALGDVLWIEPIIRALASKYKSIVVYTKYNELFENYPFKNVSFKHDLSILEKILIKIEKITHTHFFSINLDGAYEKQPEVHFLHAYQLKAGLTLTREYPKIYLSEEEQVFRKVKEQYVVLHLESSSNKSYRQIYGIDWDEITSLLKSKGYTVVQIGLQENKLRGATYISTSLRELISLVYHCSLFIGYDSGPSHIAASLGVKTMTFFGAITPSLRHFPDLLNGVVMKQPCETFDCHHNGYDNELLSCQALSETKVPRCCIFKTDQVIFKIEELLQTHAPKIPK